LTIEELLNGKQVAMPPVRSDTFKKAGFKGKKKYEQNQLIED
jgi:hypothetical protein